MLLPRYRSKNVEILGETYYKAMSDVEWHEKVQKVWFRVDDVKTHRQLEDFIAKVLAEPMDLFDNVSARFYLIPDFMEGKSVYVFNHHHSQCDGVGLYPQLIAMSDNQNFKVLGQVKPPSLLEKIKHHLLLPLTIPQVLMSWLQGVCEQNEIQNFNEGPSK
jgi:hypothetical protein